MGFRFLVGVMVLSAGAAAAGGSSGRNSPKRVPIRLDATVVPTAFRDTNKGDVRIAGEADGAGDAPVRLRVTTSRGVTTTATAAARDGAFECRYPRDFAGAPALEPGFLFVDATRDAEFDRTEGEAFQAEATLLVYDGRARHLPEFPSGFTNDLLDRTGGTDSGSAEWPVIRSLVNLYMRSRAARLCGVGRADFDLARPADLTWYKNNLTLYEFDHRDRDWSKPLGRRTSRTFWQAVWNTWFNASNNHPLDGDDRNNRPSNFVPYAFANDFPDILMLYLLRRDLPRVLDDNLEAICGEGLDNFLNMQHREESNFALPDRKGRTHVYTAGAFRYGMFETGEFLTEGKGWFHNPEFADYVRGGVFNGRAVWALGMALRRYPEGEMSGRLRASIALALRFCLHDALAHGYAKKSPQGRVYWYDAGESGYLLLGMLEACEVAPDLVVASADGTWRRTLRELCVEVMNAMVDLVEPPKQWSIYADKDPMAIAALCDGARVLQGHPDAPTWRKAAIEVADAWMAAKPDAADYPAPLVHFGQRRVAPDKLSFEWEWTATSRGRTFVIYYISGHWIHALAKLYAMTGDERYRGRAEKMVSYFCGANPWNVRLLNEIGGVYNWVDDTDRDGVEDRLKQDMYPESTAFCQIGIHYLMRAIVSR